jgi:hypothetical protein
MMVICAKQAAENRRVTGTPIRSLRSVADMERPPYVKFSGQQYDTTGEASDGRSYFARIKALNLKRAAISVPLAVAVSVKTRPPLRESPPQFNRTLM